MHLFLRIQTLAQILGYRLFSLTYSNICLMARPEDLVLYKVMPTRDIVKCSSINMTNARLISNRKHKLPSQHKFSALSCRRADRVDSGRRLHSRRLSRAYQISEKSRVQAFLYPCTNVYSKLSSRAYQASGAEHT